MTPAQAGPDLVTATDLNAVSSGATHANHASGEPSTTRISGFSLPMSTDFVGVAPPAASKNDGTSVVVPSFQVQVTFRASRATLGPAAAPPPRRPRRTQWPRR